MTDDWTDSPATGLVAMALVAATLCLLTACQKNTPAAPELPDLTIGVIGVTQPMGTTDLLAGFIPDDRVLASPRPSPSSTRR